MLELQIIMTLNLKETPFVSYKIDHNLKRKLPQFPMFCLSFIFFCTKVIRNSKEAPKECSICCHYKFCLNT